MPLCPGELVPELPGGGGWAGGEAIAALHYSQGWTRPVGHPCARHSLLGAGDTWIRHRCSAGADTPCLAGQTWLCLGLLRSWVPLQGTGVWVGRLSPWESLAPIWSHWLWWLLSVVLCSGRLQKEVRLAQKVDYSAQRVASPLPYDKISVRLVPSRTGTLIVPLH